MSKSYTIPTTIYNYYSFKFVLALRKIEKRIEFLYNIEYV